MSQKSRITRLEREAPPPEPEGEYHMVISWDQDPQYFRDNEPISREEYPSGSGEVMVSWDKTSSTPGQSEATGPKLADIIDIGTP